MVDEELERLRTGFLREHCHHFEASEENKLIYMQLFQQYQGLVEGALVARLRAAVPGFSMPEFLKALGAREDLLDSDMFDLLLSFSEFSEFKELMLAFRDEDTLGAGFGLTLDVRPAGILYGVAEVEPRPDMEVDLLLVDPLQGAEAGAAVGGGGAGAGAGGGGCMFGTG